MKLLAIDPGDKETAWCIVDTEPRRILGFAKEDNLKVLLALRDAADVRGPFAGCDVVCVEMVASYGMPVGAEVFETVVWIGRFMEAWSVDSVPDRLTRNEVKMALCHRTAPVNDSVIRQRLIDLWGPPGKKKAPGPTYGITADVWAALAVASAWMVINGAWKGTL